MAAYLLIVTFPMQTCPILNFSNVNLADVILVIPNLLKHHFSETQTLKMPTSEHHLIIQ